MRVLGLEMVESVVGELSGCMHAGSLRRLHGGIGRLGWN